MTATSTETRGAMWKLVMLQHLLRLAELMYKDITEDEDLEGSKEFIDRECYWVDTASDVTGYDWVEEHTHFTLKATQQEIWEFSVEKIKEHIDEHVKEHWREIAE